MANICFWLFLLLLSICGTSQAVICVSGCNNNVTTTMSGQLSAAENNVGATKSSNSVTVPGSTVRYSPGYANGWGVYKGSSVPPPGTTQAGWTYTQIDDYISVALRDTDECDTRYVPFNTTVKNSSNCQYNYHPVDEDAVGSPHTYQSQIRIDKKIVSGTYSKNILIAEFGLCQPGGTPSGCAKKDVIRNRVYLNMDFTVPQKCTINAGQVINIDFGNISSGAFTTAGARPEGVNGVVRNVSIDCDNIAANTAMTVRLQADKVSGNAVVTNTNNDVGFVVADGNGTALTPNNLSSVIPFSLGNDNKSSVTIRVYPVSVTGNKPAEGPVTSQAYLRVDFA
ncbi:fimbrial protein [Serratia marcescens]|nr:fimbrial protein [Serratia marcescens]POP14814.1 adhesin [Serratia marcescens]